ncbi:MAG: YARHG domain-containing protein [Arenimonas sp.]
MSTSNFKKLACSLSVISVLLFAGCGKKTEETLAPTVAEKPTDIPATLAPPAEVAGGFEKLGLFSGQFNPNEDFSKKQAEYEKWLGTIDQETISELTEIPAQFRPYVHKNPLYGYYTFIAPNRLSIVIDEIRDDKTFSAHSISAGNQRVVTGTWETIENGFHLVGSEPGDDPNDGSFDMTLNAEGLNGNWTPKGGSAMPKAFKLASTKYEYDPQLGQNEKKEQYVDLGYSDFQKNPSVDKLNSKDVENLTQPHIRIIRNLIFARHGYSFKGKDLRLTFESYDWYTPVTNDVKDDLTELEKANIALLTRYEKYAEKHYDEFGR